MRTLFAWLMLCVPLWGAAGPVTLEAGKIWALPEVVAYALEHNPELKLGEAEVNRRDGESRVAQSGLRPQVDLAGDALADRFKHGFPPGTPPAQTQFDEQLFSGSVKMQMLLWDFGKSRSELEASRLRTVAAQQSLARRRQEVIFETARLYLQALTITDLRQAADSRRQSLQSFLDRTEQLVQAQRAVPVDALKIKTRLAQIESDLAALEASRTAARSALASFIGLDGELPELAYRPAPAAEEILLPSDAPAEIREAMRQRPDAVARLREVAAGEKSAVAVERSRWPRVDFRAYAVEYLAPAPESFSTLIGHLLPAMTLPPPSTEHAMADWGVGVCLTFPLYDGGRRQGQMATAAAQLEQARQKERQLQLGIRREAQTSLADWQSAVDRVKSLRQNVAEAEQVLINERLKFEAGRSVVNFVLDAEAALLTSQSLLAQARRSAEISRFSWQLAIGKLDPSDLMW